MKNFFYFAILLINIILFLIFTVTQHFSIYAIIIHGISIFILIGLMVHFYSVNNLIKTHFIDVVILVFIFIFAFGMYVYKVDIITPGIQGDELTIAKTSEQILSGQDIVPFVSTNYGHPTPLLYATGLNIKFFGKTLFAIRLTSIIFGALSIVAFYILLRLYFTRAIAIGASLLMLFSYPFVVVSRLAYEVTPEIFFLILSTIFFSLAWKTKDARCYIATGLILGAGLYTYVGFRTFAIVILLLIVALNLKIRRTLKTVPHLLFGLFIITVPLFSYGIGHTNEIMARTIALSPFTQNFSNSEIMMELGANLSHLPRLFFRGDSKDPNGDANFKQNPSNASMFDVGTFLLLLIGTLALLRKSRSLFLIVLAFLSASILNDILSIERIPQAMNLYGVGHPNTLRMAGIIPVIYFIAAYGLDFIRRFLQKIDNNISWFAFVFTIGVLAFTNFYLYYAQPLNQWFSIYVYEMNNVRSLHIAGVINRAEADKIYMSPSFINDDRIQYFSRKNLTLIPFKPKSVTEIFNSEHSKDLIILDPDYNPKLGKALLTAIQERPDSFKGNVLTSPDNKIDAFIMSKETINQ